MKPQRTKSGGHNYWVIQVDQHDQDAQEILLPSRRTVSRNQLHGVRGHGRTYHYDGRSASNDEEKAQIGLLKRDAG